MRTFILHARKAATAPVFKLEDLPSSGGRMDVVARCVLSALFISHDMRRDTEIITVLNGPPKPPVSLLFNGSAVKRMAPDERSIAIWIKKALEKAPHGRLDNGIEVRDDSLQAVVKKLKARPIYLLHEKGKPMEEVQFEPDPVFVLGDHLGLPPKDEKFVLRYAKEKVSLGPTPYLASSVISVLHWAADRRGL